MVTWTVALAFFLAATTRCPEKLLTVTFAALQRLDALPTVVEMDVTVMVNGRKFVTVRTSGTVLPGKSPPTSPAIEKALVGQAVGVSGAEGAAPDTDGDCPPELP
jgi:hypothetical protein